MAECLTIKGLCTVRVTRLDPVTGVVEEPPDNYAVAESQISLALTADIEEGTEETFKNGCGVIQASDQQDDIFKRWTMEFQMAKFDPAFLEIMIGATVEVDAGGDPIGIVGANELSGSFQRPLSAFEVWTKLFDGDAQSASRPWGYFMVPASRWRLGNTNLGEQFTPVVLSGRSQTNSLWGNGPYDDLGDFDAQIPTWAVGMLDIADPPEATCGYADIASSS
jgi:hypothetical protein